MIMTYHYFQNIDAETHYEKMKQGDSIKMLSYVPDLNTYVISLKKIIKIIKINYKTKK